MNKREILIICLLLCIICSISAVSAADVNADDTNKTLATSDEEVVGASNDLSLSSISGEDILKTGGGSFTQLNEKINGDNSATIDLEMNYTYTSSDSAYVNGISFTKAITIDGHGYTIDGNNLARIFAIGYDGHDHSGTAGAVVLKNIIFANAYSNSGNQNQGFGAVEFYGVKPGSTLLIQNCTFLNNKAPTAAALSLGYSYDNIVNITNCTFDGNTATSLGGGAIRLRNNVANLKITNSVFKNNKASSSDGGAIHISSSGAGTLIKNCTFTSNEAYTLAGAISCSVDELTVDNCSFTSNSANQTNLGRAGAIYITGKKALINNSRFTDNSATYNSNVYGGGAIEVGSASVNSVINNCTFIGNNAQKGHGGAITSQNSVNLTINNSKFESNYAGSGGALFFESPTDLMMFNNTFKSNYVVGQFGGAIHFNTKTTNVHLLNSSFISNHATYGSNGRGGAIRFDSGNDNSFNYFYIYNVDFIDNHALQEGGAFSHNQRGKYFYFENCTFINCTTTATKSDVWGGGMYFNAIDSKLKNITFINCSSQKGGSLAIKWSTNTIFENITIINSSAGLVGGAVAVWDSNSVFANATIINSSAEGNGGAIYWGYMYGSSRPTGGNMYNVTIINSTSSANGGAIYWLESQGTLRLINIINASAQNGGGMYISGENIDIYDSNIANSTSTYDGGALYFNTNYHKVTNCTFKGCNATRYGGAVYVGSYIYIYFYDSTFNDSYAYNGGAFYYAGSVGTIVSIHNSTFTNNIASHNGGAIYYVVVDDTGSDDTVIYRDYNNFDDEGDISAGRTTLTMKSSAGSTYVKRIDDCYFKDNEDYILAMTASSATDTVLGTVIVSRPKDPNGHDFTLVINITKDDALVTQIILDSYQDYVDYFRTAGFVVSTRVNLTRNTEYNVTVGFEDSAYLYKEAKSSFRTADTFERGDFKILQSLIDAAISGNKIVELTRDYIFTAVEDWEGKVQDPDDWCMNITDTITINGNGYSIDALAYARIFNITGEKVIINDVRLINGNTSGIYNDNIPHTGKTKAYGDGIQKGGAIFWAGKNGVINNSVVSNNFAEYGGGIYFNSTATDCNVTNNIFSTNNATKNGGAIECNASNMRLYNTTFQLNRAENGAALCREASATNGSGRNNTFISNHATIAGAALAWMKAENIYIDTYKFKDNTAGFSGGAIYVGIGSTNCTVFNSTFVGNNVTNLSEGHGGAIEWYADTGRILNSTFTNNNAYTGGAIYVGKDPNKDDAGHINITNSGFIGNNAITLGGAIDLVASSVAVNNSYFRENTAENGGAIFAGGTGDNNYVYSAVFMYNNATVRGGAVNWNSTAGRIGKSNFTGNLAEYGGAVYIGGSSPNSRIENVIFKQNNATRNGGAIDWNATGGQLYNTQFISNYAGEYGAALCRESGATGGSGKNNTFKYNHADIAGAALAWLNVTGIHINDYKFYYNTANASGAAIFIGNGSDNSGINGSVFVGNNITNETGGHGGAIDIVADNTNVTNSNFTNNNAFYGGAIFVGSKSGNTYIADTTFRDNTAEVDGGAINLQASGVKLNETYFYKNTAQRNGGALYVGGQGTTNVIYNSLFDDNDALNNGGAIYWRAYAGHVAYSNFTSNDAVNGGAIYLNGVSSNTNITHVIFKYNNATKNGGAIDCNATRMNLTYTLFESNYAGEYGAALCREKGATSGFGGYNNFTSNHAGIAGAALAWMNVSNININHYIFTDNTADRMGGAIYASEGSDNFTINNCDFKGNNITNATDGYGGAIFSDSSNNTIKNSNFTNNNAFYGGAVYVDGDSGHTNVTNVTFDRNNAAVDGGAINLIASGVRLNDTRFYNNTAQRNGGAVYVGGEGKTNVIYYSRFTDNKANGHGGAIDWRASAGEVMESNFVRNSAEYGGAIYLNGISTGSKISRVYFGQNTASKNGGAIDCNATLMNLTHTLFVLNRAEEYGAALCRESQATGGFGLNNTFDKNHAGISGAALAWMNVSNIKINNYTFTNNNADYSGGAIYVSAGSDNCKVYNSTFEDNYISNAIDGRGGAIDWIGDNGGVENTTFTRCISVNAGGIYVGEESHNMFIQNVSFTSCESLTNGGAIVIAGDNVTVVNSNFTSSVARDNGGAIAGLSSDNGNITNCTFTYNVVGGHIDPQGNIYGEGGAIYWENSKNLTMYNNSFETNAARLSGGSISANNVSDSVIDKMRTHDETAFTDGGSIAWINSDNVTIKNGFYNDSGSNYKGGTFYFENVNATVKDTIINSTWASWGKGGAIYVAGNVTIDKVSFNDTHSYEDNATAIYFESGTSKVSNSNFTNSINSIGIQKGANVTLTKNNLTASDPNKSTMYIKENTTEAASLVKYAVWNEGDLSLDKNNFDYVIFNNGTIWTKTTTKMLNNGSYEVDWNNQFVFFANITDDNLNTIISVSSLRATNDVYQDVGASYLLPYNADEIQCIYQGVFHLKPMDSGLNQNTPFNGTLKVKMPVNLTVDVVDITTEGILVNATLKPVVKSNFTIKNQNVTFNIYDLHGNLIKGGINATITNIDEKALASNGITFTTWTLANVTKEIKENLMAGNYRITASYEGDDVHKAVENFTTFDISLRLPYLEVIVENIYWGQNATIIVNTNGTGRVLLFINGKTQWVNITAGRAEYNETGLEPGNYSVVATYPGDGGRYFTSFGNGTQFEVYKLNTTVQAFPTTPITVDDLEKITVQVNTTAGGFAKITINGKDYYAIVESGIATFEIPNLAKDEYTDIPVTFLGDTHFNQNSTKTSFVVGTTSDYTITVHADNISYGQNATIYISLPTSVSENLTVFINNDKYENVTVVNGMANLTVPNLAVGTYTVNVTYPGDNVYAPKEKNGTIFKVSKTDSYSINVTAVDVKVGENTTITVHVPKDAKGNVTIWVNGTKKVNSTIVDGVATFTLNKTEAGKYEVNATLSDANYANKTAYADYYVSKFETPIEISVNPAKVGDQVKITVTVPSDVSNNVTIEIAGKSYNKTADATGKAVFTVPSSVNTTRTVVATYGGDRKYMFNSTTANFTVNKRDSHLNVTAVGNSVGENATITVQLERNATGYVNVDINGTVYSIALNSTGGGKLEIALGNGTYNVHATYLGDNQYLTSTNNTESFKMTKVESEISVSVENITFGDVAVVNVTVSDDATGNVTVKVNNTVVTVGIVGGKAIAVIPGLKVGNYSVDVKYNGDGKYLTNTNKTTFEVGKVNMTEADITVVDQGNGTVVVIVPSNATGNVTIYVNGTNYTANVTNGTAVIVLENVTPGKHNITVVYSGDGNYTNVTTNSTVVIPRYETPIKVVADNIYVGDTANIRVELPQNATGRITIEINGKVYEPASFEHGAAIFEVDNLTYGNKTVAVKYYGDGNYTSNSTTANFTVSKRVSSVNVTAESTTVGSDLVINVTIPQNATGYVIVNIGGTDFVVNTTDGNGTLTLKGFNKGDYHIDVTYIGDDQYLPNVNSTDVSVSKIPSNVNVTVEDIGSGVAVVTVEVPDDATGNVTVKVNKTVVTVGIVDGKAVAVIPNLDVGNYTVNVTYNGDRKYGSSTNKTALEIKKVKLESEIVVIDQGNGTVVVVVGDNATGNVTITVGDHEYNATVINGTAVVNVNNETPGTHEVKVIYSGDTNHNATTQDANVTIPKYDTEMNTTIGEAKEGVPVVITVEVPKNATGNVTVYIDGKEYPGTVVGGNAIVTVDSLTAGNKTVTVEYHGDGNYTANYTIDTFTVEKAKVTPDINVVDLGNGTVVVVVGDNATGNVTVKVGDKEFNATVINGTAVVTLENITPGEQNITVIYSGDDNHGNATVNATVDGPKYDTVVDVSVVADNQTAVITVTVPGNATGNVTVTIDGKEYPGTVEGGKVVVTVDNLTPGNKTVIVEYSGDDNYAANYTIDNFTIDQPVVTPDIKVIDQGNGTVVVVVGDNATGNVTVKVGDTDYNATVINGTAVVILENITPGEQNITVIYSGDDNHGNATVNATVVGPKYDTVVDVKVVTDNQTAVITVSVPENATGNVTVTIDGKEYPGTVDGGVAIVTVDNLTPGNKTVIVEYSGDDNYTANYTVSNFTIDQPKVTPEIVVIDQGNGTVVVVVGDNATGNVTITVGDHKYNATVVNGTAVLNINNETPGIHEIEVIYSGDDTHSSASETAKITSPKYDSEMNVTVGEAKEGEPFTITVEVPEGASGDVIVNVGGQNYTGTIDQGKVTVTVENVSAGSHTIAVEYLGDDNYNANYSIAKVTVEAAKTTPEIVVVDQGNGTVVVVVGDNATGNVTVKVGDKEYNATVINGTAVVTLENITPGEQNITVIYTGDDNHNGTAVNTTVVGPKYDTVVDVKVVTDNQTAVITVSVPENATGNVTVTIDGKEYPGTVEDGKVVITVDNLTPGNKTVIVEYSGDDNYTANYTVSNFTIEQPKVTPDIKVIDQGNGTVVVVVGDNATGNVTVKVGDKEYNATVINGTAVVTLDNVTPGTHEIEVIYSGDDTHSNATETANITAPKYDAPINVTVSEAKEGEAFTITVEVPEDATGDVIVSVGGKDYPGSIKDGKAVVTVENVSDGDHTIAVEYLGDENYKGNYSTSNVTVETAKAVPDVKVIDHGNGTVVVVVGDNATGNVTVTVDGQNYTAEVINGTAVVTLDNVTPGTHDIEVIYSGDDTHSNATANATIDVSKRSTPISIDVENIKVGDKAVIKVNVAEDCDGNVTIEIDGKKYTEIVTAGVATFEIEGLTAGNKSVFAVYNGDAKYEENYTSEQFDVGKVVSKLTVSIKDISVGENITITVEVPSDATGQVLIDIDGVGYYLNVTDGKGTAEIPHLTAGSYNVTLTYTGDDKYLSSSNATTVKVSKLESFVIPIAHNIYVGENENIRLLVPSDATGNVTVVIDGEAFNFNLDTGVLGAVYSEGAKYNVAISGGNGELVISGLPKGEYTVSVMYNGDEKYLPAVNTTIFTVSKATTPMDVVDQGNGTIVVTVPENATGNVTVTVDNVTYTSEVVDGKAVIVLENTTPGKHDITVEYSGDNNYASNSTQLVADIPKYATPISVEVEDINVGDVEIVTVTLPEKATGKVTIEINGKEYTTDVENGKAIFKVPDLAFGNKTVAVKYSGDDSYNDNYTTGQFVVSKLPSSISAVGKDITVGKDEVITVTVPSDATGKVLITIDGVGYYGEITNGKAKIIIPELPAGKYSATVTYEGDDKYMESTAPVTFTVNKVKAPVRAEADDINEGEDATVIVHVPSDATGTVTITIDGKQYTANVDNGVAVFVIPGLTRGDHNIVAFYSGDDKYDANDNITDIEVLYSQPDGPDNHSSEGKHAGAGVMLSEYATGNPILVLLLLLMIGSTQIRRFKK